MWKERRKWAHKITCFHIEPNLENINAYPRHVKLDTILQPDNNDVCEN